MDYRNYIGVLKKDIKRECNYEDLIKDYSEENYIRPYDLLETEHLHEFGKYFNINILEKELEDFFNSFNYQKLEESEFKIFTKEALWDIIKHYEKLVLNFYKSLIEKGKDSEKETSRKCINEIKQKINIWSEISPVPNKDNKIITDSWFYEYAIFQLIYLYKNFDWENNTVIWYGY